MADVVQLYTVEVDGLLPKRIRNDSLSFSQQLLLACIPLRVSKLCVSIAAFPPESAVPFRRYSCAAGDGCAEAEQWVRNIQNPPPPDPNAPPPIPKRETILADLPAQCASVIASQ